MSYHISNLGNFSRYVLHYADMDGFVPQAGDKEDDFMYEPIYSDLVQWDEWVKSAIEATAEAERAAQQWREDNP